MSVDKMQTKQKQRRGEQFPRIMRVLRHGLSPGSNGWLRIDELVKLARDLQGFSPVEVRKTLMQKCLSCEKARITIQFNGKEYIAGVGLEPPTDAEYANDDLWKAAKIKANQGHSTGEINVKDLPPLKGQAVHVVAEWKFHHYCKKHLFGHEAKNDITFEEFKRLPPRERYDRTYGAHGISPAGRSAVNAVPMLNDRRMKDGVPVKKDGTPVKVGLNSKVRPLFAILITPSEDCPGYLSENGVAVFPQVIPPKNLELVFS